MFVYQPVAKFVCPFTGMEGKPDRESRTTTMFATREVAESRAEKFKDILRARFRVRPDYPIEVTIVPFEVIQE